MFRRTMDSFEKEIDELDRTMERMWDEFRNIEWAKIPANRPVYYGVSVTVGSDGIPRIEQFGNIERGHLAIGEGMREPFVQVLVDEDHGELHFTAELPGVPKEKALVDVTDDGISVRAEAAERKYEKIVALDAIVDPSTARATMSNGVLDVTAKLVTSKKRVAGIGRRVRVE